MVQYPNHQRRVLEKQACRDVVLFEISVCTMMMAEVRYCIVTCARSASTILSVVASGGLSDSMIALITNSNINPNADCIV